MTEIQIPKRESVLDFEIGISDLETLGGRPRVSRFARNGAGTDFWTFELKCKSVKPGTDFIPLKRRATTRLERVASSKCKNDEDPSSIRRVKSGTKCLSQKCKNVKPGTKCLSHLAKPSAKDLRHFDFCIMSP